jgi:hypothetical protein
MQRVPRNAHQGSQHKSDDAKNQQARENTIEKYETDDAICTRDHRSKPNHMLI